MLHPSFLLSLHNDKRKLGHHTERDTVTVIDTAFVGSQRAESQLAGRITGWESKAALTEAVSSHYLCKYFNLETP